MQHINEMLASMTGTGLLVDNLLFDGELHRVATLDKPSQKNGWYVAFADGKSVMYGDWRSGIKEICSDKTKSITREDLITRNVAKVLHSRAKLAKEVTSAEACLKQWFKADEVLTHPYLVRKRIKPYGIRVDQNNNLLVPVLDDRGKLISLQYIDENGNKRFKAGGRLKCGALLLGSLTAQSTVLVCEGYATGCSLHEATGLPTIVAFNAGNLMDVCTLYKTTGLCEVLVVCSDNDHQSERKNGRNTGLEIGKEVATKLNLRTIWPTFESDNDGSDFNDVHCQHGLEHLRVILSQVLAGGSN
jgi:putative DNA primase/helicase